MCKKVYRRSSTFSGRWAKLSKAIDVLTNWINELNKYDVDILRRKHL